MYAQRVIRERKEESEHIRLELDRDEATILKSLLIGLGGCVWPEFTTRLIQELHSAMESNMVLREPWKP